jgi:hypothetical protein
MLHRYAALTAALAATGALAVPAVAADGPAVKGDGFTTTLPSGWTSHTGTASGVKQYLWGSHGTTVSRLGIPTAGGIGMSTIAENTALLARQLRRRPSKDPVALLPEVVGIPKGATHLKVVTKVHGTALAGTRAAAGTVSYTYKKRSIVQSDIVAWHGSRAYFVEMDVDGANVAKGNAALKSVTAAWKFTN